MVGLSSVFPMPSNEFLAALGDLKKSESKLSDSVEAVHIEATAQHFDEEDSIEQTDTGKVTWLIVAAVSLGGFLFGISPFSCIPSSVRLE